MAVDPGSSRPLPAPPARCDAGATGFGPLVLERVNGATVDATVAAVNASFAELHAWMPWAATAATPESIGAFRHRSEQAWEEGREFQFTMGLDTGNPGDRVVGACGIHTRQGPGILEIGYWVRSDRTGRGVATAAAGALVGMARAMPGIHELQIRCDRANVASGAVARRLGFTLAREEPRGVEAPAESGVTLVWLLPVSLAPAPDDPTPGYPPPVSPAR